MFVPSEEIKVTICTPFIFILKEIKVVSDEWKELLHVYTVGARSSLPFIPIIFRRGSQRNHNVSHSPDLDMLAGLFAVSLHPTL